MRNSWNINVSYVSKKATKFLHLLRRHMYTCRVSSKQKAFRELVIPVPDYVSTVWSPKFNDFNIMLLPTHLLKHQYTGSMLKLQGLSQ